MNYSVEFNGTITELPAYSFKAVEKFEKVDTVCASRVKHREKCKAMYDCITDLIGKPTTLKLVGDFTEADPNAINILYFSIIRAYKKPIDDFNEAETAGVFENESLEKISKLTEQVRFMQSVAEKNK